MRALILGGTTEAADLAARAVDRFGDRFAVITSLAGRIEPRRPLAGRVRVGGFGGAEGLAHYLRSEAIKLVIDATHPFAAQISRNAAEACQSVGVPRLMLVRPPWRAAPGDKWIEVDTINAAGTFVATHARRVFLTTGPGALMPFADNVSVWFLVRVFQPLAQPLPLEKCSIIVARPPFTVAGERNLLQEHRIDTLVTKNSGGPTEAKLAAARETGTRVIMVQRPARPDGECVETADAALAWIDACILWSQMRRMGVE